MDNIDLADSGVRFPRIYRAAGSAATRMLLMANSISVLLPVYRRTLIDKYRGENVHFRAHGILGGRPEPPDFSLRGNPEHRILAFGKWGTYKRLELLIEAFEQLSSDMPNVRLIVAGGNHPQTPGYVESVAQTVARQRTCRIYRLCGGRGHPRTVPDGQRAGAALFFCYRSQRRSPPCVRIRRPNHIGRHR